MGKQGEDWTNSHINKWISVACVYLMVIAAFYVMTADVSAEDAQPSNEMVDEAVTSIEHIDRRITT
ncbi:MAG: hypothetical protein AB9819_06755 [Methanomassiliicoccales archaeon]